VDARRALHDSERADEVSRILKSFSMQAPAPDCLLTSGRL